MLILHSILRAGYFRRTSAIVLTFVLSISEDGNSVNFGFTSVIGSGCGISERGDSACARTCVAVEVRMQTLYKVFEIDFLTYSDITRLCLSLYHVLERKTLLRQSYRV